MKLIFDQNISHRILKVLSDRFVNSTSVKRENLVDSLDKAIWEFAKKSNYLIVTQDSDFNDLNLLNGFPPKIIWIRAGNLRTEELAKILEDHFDELKEFESNSEFGCFEIVALKK